MFCRVCGLRVRVEERYRTPRSFGYGYGSGTKLADFRVLWHGRTELTEVPGTGMNVMLNSQKFRVRT